MVDSKLSYVKIGKQCGCSRGTVYNFVRERKRLMQQHPDSISLTGSADTSINALYHDAVAKWTYIHPSEPVPPMVIRSDESGNITITVQTYTGQPSTDHTEL